VYDSVVEHERLAGVLGRLIWGTDTSAFFREIARLGEETDGTVIRDVPCGGGVAFRGLRPGQRVRYVAGDLSPVMLRRARAQAKRRDLDQIEFTEADVEALPFDDASFDLCVSYTGLHCFPDPAAAICEIARSAPGRRAAALHGPPAGGAAPRRVRAPVSGGGRVRPERHLGRVRSVAR
jgi:SAM-dependent methyltransferase